MWQLHQSPSIRFGTSCLLHKQYCCNSLQFREKNARKIGQANRRRAQGYVCVMRCRELPPRPPPHRNQSLFHRGCPAHFRIRSKRLGVHFGGNPRHLACIARNAPRPKRKDDYSLKKDRCITFKTTSKKGEHSYRNQKFDCGSIQEVALLSFRIGNNGPT